MKPEGGVRRYQSGALPFTVEAYIDTYDGPSWVKRQLRGRAGWLQVLRARLQTDISDWSATIVAGLTDDGERLGQITANAFLAMQTSGPQTCFDDPPDELADVSEMLFWDFLGRCDLRHLDMLEEAEVTLAARLAVEQARGETVLGQAEHYMAELRRRRRSAGVDEAEREAIDERIAFMDDKHAAASGWLIRHMAKLRRQGEAFEADVMAALENHGEVEELYTVHWVARSQYDRLVDRGLLRELTATGSLSGVPQRSHLDEYDRWEINQARRPDSYIEPKPKQKKRRERAPAMVDDEASWHREEQELLTALERWQADKIGLGSSPAAPTETAVSPRFPPHALAPTTAKPIGAISDVSTDVGALIDSEMAALLKDVRQQ